MNTKRFLIFSVLAAMLSLAGISLPVNAQANTVIKATTPTPQPALKTVIFDLKSANKVPPADIINQISFSGQGGGDLCKASSYPSPVIVSDPIPTQELMVYSYMAACGWGKNEKLTGSVKFPNGQIQNFSVVAEVSSKSYLGIIRFRPGVNDPIGKYTLTITGNSKSVQASANYTSPKGAHLYKLDSNHLLLYGFSPSESARFFFYASKDKSLLKGWQEYITGADGRLEIQTSMKIEESDFFVATGKKTGEIHLLFDGFNGGTQSRVNQSTIKKAKALCPNGMPSRIKVGDRARAAYTDGAKLRIRVAPGFSENFDHRIAEGTSMTILDGPKCVDGSTWWKVEVSPDVKGWVAEYWDGDEYLIEPAR